MFVFMIDHLHQPQTQDNTKQHENFDQRCQAGVCSFHGNDHTNKLPEGRTLKRFPELNRIHREHERTLTPRTWRGERGHHLVLSLVPQCSTGVAVSTHQKDAVKNLKAELQQLDHQFCPHLVRFYSELKQVLYFRCPHSGPTARLLT